MEKKFKSFEEIVSDPIFNQCLNKELDSVRRTRVSRPAAPEGMHYKRDWYDRIRDGNKFSTPFFIKHLPSIWRKDSLLSSEERNIISSIGTRALGNTYNEYQKLTANVVPAEEVKETARIIKPVKTPRAKKIL